MQDVKKGFEKLHFSSSLNSYRLSVLAQHNLNYKEEKGGERGLTNDDD